MKRRKDNKNQLTFIYIRILRDIYMLFGGDHQMNVKKKLEETLYYRSDDCDV